MPRGFTSLASCFVIVSKTDRCSRAKAIKAERITWHYIFVVARTGPSVDCQIDHRRDLFCTRITRDGVEAADVDGISVCPLCELVQGHDCGLKLAARCIFVQNEVFIRIVN